MPTQKILRAIVLTGIFVLPFIALIVSTSMYFPFITGKNFTFRVIVEVITGAWVLLALVDPTYRPKRNSLFISIIAFLAVILIADIFGKYAYKSIWSNYERMEGFVTLLHLAVYCFIAATTLTKKLWQRLFDTNLFASFIIAIYALVQLGGGAEIHQGGTRVDASLGNATYLAIYMLFNVFFALVMMIRRRGTGIKLTYGISIILNLVVLYYTATRGALLGILAGLFLTALLIAIGEKGKIRKVALGTVIVVLVIIGGFFAVRKSSFVQKSPVLSRFASISLTERTTQSRFLIWKMAFDGWKERPILGWGQENFNYVFNKLYSPEMYNQEQWFDRTHNVVLDWLIAGGVLGLVTYLSLFVSSLWILWRRTEGIGFTEKSILTGLFAGYFIHNLFVFDNLTSYILFFTVLAYIYSASIPRERKHEHVWKMGTEGSQATLPVVIVVTLAALYFINVPSILASRQVIVAIAPGQQTPAQRLDQFKKALDYNGFGSPEIREQLISYFSNVVQEPTISPDVKTAYFNYVKKQVETQLKKTPDDARYQLFAGTFYHNAGFLDKKYLADSLTYFNKALSLSPEKQSIKFEVGATYINMQEYAKAYDLLKATYEAEPRYEEAKFLYALSAIYAGHNDVANGLIATMNSSQLSDQRLANAYLVTKQYATLKALFENRVKQTPDDVQLHISLAAVYMQLNDRAGAIRELETIKKLNPQFKDQADAYIQQIREGKNPTQ